MKNNLIFNNAKILVIGDVILDIYKYGDVSRISPEAPVPVVLISHETNMAGGAANLAVNLKALKCDTIDLVGYIGQDNQGRQLMEILAGHGIDQYNLIMSVHPTITKTRVLANKQHMIRYDCDSLFNTKLHRQSREKMLTRHLKRLGKERKFDIVVISDYAKGTVTDKVMYTIRSCFSCPIICDFKPVNSSLFNEVFCITPNLDEAKQLAAQFEYKDLHELAIIIKQSLDVEAVIITLSQDGICLLDQDDKYYKFDARVVVNENKPANRLDVTGAGDTVVSALAACLATGHSLPESVKLGNLAAGVVVSKTGTATCSIEELQSADIRM